METPNIGTLIITKDEPDDIKYIGYVKGITDDYVDIYWMFPVSGRHTMSYLFDDVVYRLATKKWNSIHILK